MAVLLYNQECLSDVTGNYLCEFNEDGGHYTAGTVGGDGVTIGLLTAVLDLSCSFWLTLVFQLFLV